MRRRQLFEERERQLIKERDQMKDEVPNSNIISKSAQPALKEKAEMFLPHEKDIQRPNATPFRKAGSKPGKGVAKKTYSKSELKGK